MLAPGAILLGNARTCFECGHEHGVGDRCVSFHYTPELMESVLADVPGARRLAFGRTASAAVPAVRPAGCRRGSRARVGRGRGARGNRAGPGRRGGDRAGRSPASEGADQSGRAADRRSRAAHRGVGRDSDQPRRSGRAGRAQPLSFPAHLPARRGHDALSVPAAGRACTGRLSRSGYRTSRSRRSHSRPASTISRRSTGASCVSWAPRRGATVRQSAAGSPGRCVPSDDDFRRLSPWYRGVPRHSVRIDLYPIEISDKISSGKWPSGFGERPAASYIREK